MLKLMHDLLAISLPGSKIYHLWVILLTIALLLLVISGGAPASTGCC